MERFGLACTVLTLSAVGCATPSGPDTSEVDRVAPQELATAAPAPVTPPPFDPPRNRAWPKLNAWLDGESVDRAPETGEPLVPEAALAAQGKVLFGQYCYQCHGHDGHGDGPRSPLFEPPPRDLTKGVFKFRSTASGALPTRDDLFRTITGGLRGTGMMSFADLPEEHRWALVEHVRTLAPGFHGGAEPTPLSFPAPPSDLDSAAHRTRGRAVYQRLGCASCHGEAGRGDGPAAAALRDYKGRPLPAPDFATRPAKWGGDAASLFRTLTTGMNGTAMPSYATSASDEERWAVVAYVRQLAAAAPDEVDARTREEAERVLGVQAAQGKHAVEGGCGCAARRRKRKAARAGQ